MARDLWKSLVRVFVSVELTIILLVLGMILIFLATLDQVELGIYAVQLKWFRSFLVWNHLGSLTFPTFPGGYLIGGLLLINLVAAHCYRFTLSWKKSGIFLTHLGLIVLLVGELFTGILQQDFQMRLDEGETKNYSESFHFNELAVIDATDPQLDQVTAIPEKLLARSESLSHATLPFRLAVKAYYPHAVLQSRGQAAPTAAPFLATTGTGPQRAVTPIPRPVSDELTQPAAYIEVLTADKSLGTFLLSAMAPAPETFTHEGKTWQLSLRVEREYKPFSLTLLKVTHDIYPGSDIPKNFASQVRVRDAAAHEDREVKIYMNNPLRHGGFTFYQYQMNAAAKHTVFQVVRNPSWLAPYIGSITMGLGLLVQFLISLTAFATKRARATASA